MQPKLFELSMLFSLVLPCVLLIMLQEKNKSSEFLHAAFVEYTRIT